MKLDKTNIFKYLFIAICAMELIGRLFEIHDLNLFTKPLLMPLLMVYFRTATKGDFTKSFMLAILALVFSFLGDVLLIFTSQSDVFFILGLFAFAVAQTAYIFSFRNAVFKELSQLSLIYKIIYAVPFLSYSLILFYTLLPGLGDLRWAVLFYCIVISSMVIAAVYRNGRSTQESINQVILGAVFFVLSDSLIAIDMFYEPMNNSTFFVMLTYVLAQWNIVNGLQKHYNFSFEMAQKKV